MHRGISKIAKLALFFVSAIVLITNASSLRSQSRINSPYSLFGPGEVRGYDNFRSLGMGGITQGIRSNTMVNHTNPASYTAVDSLSFVFDGTVVSHIYQQQTTDLQQTSHYTNLATLNFSFPITKRWAFATGILPFSQQGYRVSDYSSDDQAGRINFLYEGTGGINQVYVGNAFRVYKGLSLGFNAAYLFGRSEEVSMAYSDSIGFFRTIYSFNEQHSGVLFTGGMQWDIPLGEGRNLILGATYGSPAQLGIDQKRFVIRSLPFSTVIDTLSASPSSDGSMQLPTHIAAGGLFRFNSRFAIGLDYQQQNWSTFTSPGRNHDLNDAFQIRMGTIYNPRVETFSGLFSRLEYRGGIRYGQSFIKLSDGAGVMQDVNELGISFGISMPVRRSLSALHFGFELARRGSDSPDLITENFYRFNVGINVYERWFMRRKFF